MSSFSAIAKKGISPHEANLLKPVLDKMGDWRVSGRQTTRTVRHDVDSLSREAIQRAWNLVIEQPPETRKVVFKHFLLRGLHPIHRKLIAELGFEPIDVVDALSNSKSEWLREFLSHDNVVRGTKKAGDRFFDKRLHKVILNAMQGRKGFFNFGEHSAKTDIAVGLIEALRHHGMPPK